MPQGKQGSFCPNSAWHPAGVLVGGPFEAEEDDLIQVKLLQRWLGDEAWADWQEHSEGFRISQTLEVEASPRFSLPARPKGQASLVHFEEHPFPAAGASLRVTSPHPDYLDVLFHSASAACHSGLCTMTHRASQYLTCTLKVSLRKALSQSVATGPDWAGTVQP